MRRLRAWFTEELTRVVRAEVEVTRVELGSEMTARIDDVVNTIESTADSERNERELAQRDAVARDDRLAASIELLAGALHALDARLETDAADRERWHDTIDWLVHEVIVAMPAVADVPSTVVGGTIDLTARTTDSVTPPPPLLLGDHVDLRDHPDLVGMPVEVRSRFSDRWTTGFEIAEVIATDDPRVAPQFRLARMSDHLPLPVVFDAASIRPRTQVSRFEVDSLDLAE